MSFTQWVLDYADWNDPRLSDEDRGLRYLRRYPDEPVENHIKYLFNHYPEALDNTRVRSVLIKNIKKLSNEQVEELYGSLGVKILSLEVIVYILSLGAPILFWKYFNPAGRGISHEYIRPLFEGLTKHQRNTYAEDALRLSGSLLRLLTAKQRTKKRCIIAVNTDGYTLQYVPKTKRTDEIVRIAIGNTASAMEFATKAQRIAFIELAVLGSGEKVGHHRIGGFSSDDWVRPWAKEVFRTIGKDRRDELYRRWELQREDDANDWHNANAHI
jgi:hypothetical protein